VYIPEVELHQATTLEEAASSVARHGPDARFLAGGTDLLVDLKSGRFAARHLVSLQRIETLRGIARTADGLRIGALTTITELERSAAVREDQAPIVDAASRLAARQIRNRATAGGNISAGVPCADLPPILTAMRATVTLWSPDGERVLPLESFHTGPRETVRRHDEVLTAIDVPRREPGFGAAYERFAQRDGNAIAVAAVAASLLLADDGTVRATRVVLGAVAPVPKMADGAARVLQGRQPDEDAVRAAARAARDAAEPISDVRGSADFRRRLVEVLTVRALGRARERAEEAAA
jgi:carbon-monoxide dehydrogenase medium subunit